MEFFVRDLFVRSFCIDIGSHFVPFLIDFRLHVIAFRFPLASFWKSLAVKLALVKMGRRSSRRDNQFSENDAERRYFVTPISS